VAEVDIFTILVLLKRADSLKGKEQIIS